MDSKTEYYLNSDPNILTNRQKSKRAKLGLAWCWGCDRNMVGEGEKCDLCGYHNKPKKIKDRG